MLQLCGDVGRMAGAVKRSAVTRRATMSVMVAAAVWTLSLCWLHAVVVVYAVSEHDEG